MTGIRLFHVPFAFQNCASFEPVDLLDRHQAYPGIPSVALFRVIWITPYGRNGFV